MPPLEGKTLVNRGFETKPSMMLSKVVGTQESCCGLQTTVPALAHSPASGEFSLESYRSRICTPSTSLLVLPGPQWFFFQDNVIVPSGEFWSCAFSILMLCIPDLPLLSSCLLVGFSALVGTLHVDAKTWCLDDWSILWCFLSWSWCSWIRIAPQPSISDGFHLTLCLM